MFNPRGVRVCMEMGLGGGGLGKPRAVLSAASKSRGIFHSNHKNTFPGTNCIKIGLPGKHILWKYSLRIDFPLQSENTFISWIVSRSPNVYPPFRLRRCRVAEGNWLERSGSGRVTGGKWTWVSQRVAAFYKTAVGKSLLCDIFTLWWWKCWLNFSQIRVNNTFYL